MENLGVYERGILKLVLQKDGLRMWIGYIWFRIEFSGGLFMKWLSTFGFHKS
jgi:hypothetical protein